MNLKNYQKLFCLGLGLLILGLAPACSPEKSEDSSSDSKAFDAAEAEMQEKIQKVMYEIPSPTDIPGLLQSTGADFDQTLANQVNKVDNYLSSNRKAALNLGVYATNLGYLTAYQRTNDAMKYMDACRKLADKLGLTETFDIDLMRRFENNLGNRDTLKTLINKVMEDSDKYLKEGNRSNIAANVLAGSFVEGLYIATALIKNYPTTVLPDDQRNLILVPLVRVVLEQESSLNEMIGLLNDIPLDRDTERLLGELKELQALYQALDVSDSIADNRGDQLLADGTLIDITNKVGSIRDGITG